MTVDMKQLSLVALYGDKNKALKEYLDQLLHKLHAGCGLNFRSYSAFQIHSTIIGLERLKDTDCMNLNFYEQKLQLCEMRFDQFPSILRDYFPLHIRIGGLDPDFGEFLSLGEKPYNRAISVNPSTKRVTLIGWPYQHGGYSDELLQLRNELEKKCNLMHKYAKYKDNDFFMVLGEIGEISQDTVTYGVEQNIDRLREWLFRNPIEIRIDYPDLKLVQYTSPSLPKESTAYFEMDGINSDPSSIKSLFSSKCSAFMI